MNMPFDPNQFLDMQINESNSTERIPVPPKEYTAIIDKVECKTWAKKDDPSVGGLKLSLTWIIDDAEVRELLGRDKVTVRQEIMLDLNDAGMLDMGKGRNVALGRLREALGLNDPGQAFAFSMLQGRVAKVNVTHRLDKDAIYEEIKQVARLA